MNKRRKWKQQTVSKLFIYHLDKTMRIFVLCIAFSAAVLAQDSPDGGDFGGGRQQWYCNLLKSEDCMDHMMDQRCGNDGVTYYNMCDLGKAHCNDTAIHQKSEGPCDPSSALTTPAHIATNVTGSADLIKSTTPAPEQAVHGSELILDFLCIALSHNDCVHEIDEVICGSDGRTYDTFCEYEKARCTHRDLHVAKTGPCTS